MAAGAQFGWRLDMVRAGDAAAAAWGDVVIAKRNVGSSYHIAVVTDDALQGVTHVVRGWTWSRRRPSTCCCSASSACRPRTITTTG